MLIVLFSQLHSQSCEIVFKNLTTFKHIAISVFYNIICISFNAFNNKVKKKRLVQFEKFSF